MRNSIQMIIAGLLFLFPFLPYFIYGENTYFTINDILDSNHVLYSIMGGNVPGAELQDGIYPSVLNGIPASCFPSSYSILAFLYSIFAPFTAYVINLFMIRVIALVG